MGVCAGTCGVAGTGESIPAYRLIDRFCRLREPRACRSIPPANRLPVLFAFARLSVISAFRG